MAKGSRLCRTCRSRAIGVGVQAVALQREAQPVGDEQPISIGQITAFEAKLTDLAKKRGQPKGELKAAALGEASQLFGRRIISKKQLTKAEASEMLDRLDDQLEALDLAGA